MDIESRLNSFDPQVRKEALLEAKKMIDGGKIAVASPSEIHNMHCHSFFSYNGYGYSPSYVVYLAKVKGFYAVGLVDFDVLDGVDEFLAAAELLGVKAICGMETRVYIEELADKEINSPGEPGIAYHLGCGFKSSAVPAEWKEFAADLKKRANDRTRKLVELVNGYLAPAVIDFDATAKEFTPFGNVTERHVCSAYRVSAEKYFANDIAKIAAFWAEKLKMELADAEKLIADPVKLEGQIRAKTMKKGGVGYVAPGPESFPTLKAMNEFIKGCGATPTLAWLNGLTPGEADLETLLALHKKYGAAAATLIPDRNFNLKDEAKNAPLVRELNRFVKTCDEQGFSLLAGTEMNAPGQKLVDDFGNDILKPLMPSFIKGIDAMIK